MSEPRLLDTPAGSVFAWIIGTAATTGLYWFSVRWLEVLATKNHDLVWIGISALLIGIFVAVVFEYEHENRQLRELNEGDER